jgi:hypothetical protein
MQLCLGFVPTSIKGSENNHLAKRLFLVSRQQEFSKKIHLKKMFHDPYRTQMLLKGAWRAVVQDNSCSVMQSLSQAATGTMEYTDGWMSYTEKTSSLP